MTTTAADVTRAFFEALTDHVNDPSESSLSRAYEVGRLALNNGLGLLDLGLMYRDAIDALREADGRRDPQRLAHAAEFLFECLAPFEMTFRGYEEANKQLHALTRQLGDQNAALRRATESAEGANKELEAFCYSVSHDLRAPVRHIQGFSQLLLQRDGNAMTPEGRHYLTTIQQSASNMAQMIDDLLNLSRIDRQDVARRPVDLNAVADEVIKELQQDLVGRDIEWRLERLPVSACDPGLIKIVFANLLSNAAKYTRHREPARIHIGQQLDGAGVPVVFVRDNGAGFDPRYAHRLFGVFQRLHAQEQFEGTGVGLATVGRIVKKHGGRIWAEGAVDQGATFYFTLG